MVNKLIVMQYWETNCPYPSHYEYKVNVYRDSKFASTGRLCESKAKCVAYIEGLCHAFRLYGDTYEIEYVDVEGEPGNYSDYFLSDNKHLLG